MSGVDRAALSGKLFIVSGMASVFWLYFKPEVEPLLTQHAGVFSDQWELLEWVFPTTCLLLMLVAGAYQVYGGVQEEKKAQRRRRI